MRLSTRKTQRRGAALVEHAFVYPVLFLIMLAIILVGMAVFRYQQVAHLAREGSRWASVHGKQYAADTGNAAATADDVKTKAVLPVAAGMRTTNITCATTWSSDNARFHTTTVTGADGQPVVKYVANTVSVTVTYSWNTGFFGTIPVSSTSTLVMSY